MNETKYIVTQDNDIIVFTAVFNHSDFERFNPKSAGFIGFFTNDEGNPDCYCYGDSFSLGLKSNPEIDNRIAKNQLGLNNY